MGNYVTDLIRLTHAATIVAQFPHAEVQLDQLKHFADWMEHQARAYQNYYLGPHAPAHANGLQQPVLPSQTWANVAMPQMPSSPASHIDLHQWLSDQAFDSDDAAPRAQHSS